MNHSMFRKTIAFVALSGLAHGASADGRITQIDFCGPEDPNHPNVVQIATETPFTEAGCDSTYAAIRVDSAHQHMIDFVRDAYLNGRPLKFVLSSQKYYPTANTPNGRCLIARVSSF